MSHCDWGLGLGLRPGQGLRLGLGLGSRKEGLYEQRHNISNIKITGAFLFPSQPPAPVSCRSDLQWYGQLVQKVRRMKQRKTHPLVYSPQRVN